MANDKGWIHANGDAGFNDLFAKEDVYEMACMAPLGRLLRNRLSAIHVRRTFGDIFQWQGSKIAEEAIRRIARLSTVEKVARGTSPNERGR